ncbi:hypothetical protein LF41_858 [Lysobacter dokdonensis DS-58]|uniref:SMODS and SLOG-associating 2TM effector domain-containing protein n=1 Tax=Lysobacter dokdonensis DS-58 TaxID=1300345 RepID=A0A0A2WNK8_9GAMM|nr:hypothetical protein [Lysobacter dokdonensis]KGQ20322.1 hypothetical protein LF41_858 [Lysobacter dokdonensis DS-58]
MTTAPALRTELIVGVTSHRDLDPAQLPHLRTQVREALAVLHERYPDLALVVVSALAEGGDRLVAEVALDAGARLVVPLPLPIDLYREDFPSIESQHAFAHLLAQAHTVPLTLVEQDLDVLRRAGPPRDRQYLHAGLFVANHCHVLFALWDGREEYGTGGTAQIVRYYLGGPVPGARRATDNLRQMLAGDDDSLVLHFKVRRNGDSAPAEGDRPCWCTSAGQRTFDAGMPPEYDRIFRRMQAFEIDRRKLDPRAVPAASEDVSERTWREADALAVRYQRRTQWAMRAIHFGAVAMGLSLLLYADLGAPDWMLWVFLGLFAAGLCIAIAAHRRDWHRKYIDYRALAEGLRVQTFWRRAGLTITGDAEFAHDNFMQKQDVELGWIRNVMRQVGLARTAPSPDADDAARAVAEVIDAWVGRPGQSGQLAYYERKSVLRERHHLRTRTVGAACLWTGIAISIVLALFHRGFDDATRSVLVTLMGALSLIAAVREAYAYRKADKELVKQYRFMHRIYRNARMALDAAAGTQEKREILRALGEAALAEHAEWALMHRDRPIEHGRP